MKFILLVEGSTERNSAGAFLKRWLDPQLSQPIRIQVVPSKGYAKLARDMAEKARMHLEGPRRDEIIAVIGLMDLYGPNFYPNNLTTVEERYTWAVEHFEKEVGLDSFRMFFAVHEFEAWLLSHPDIFPRDVRDALVAKKLQPERVNFNDPPATLLDQMYQQIMKKGYKKTTYGKDLFAKLDTSIAVQQCPYFRKMLEEMLSLAKKAGL
ncbi:MAG TPA: DUF4276 family protein [Isosphaeraceae bacterium]|nr:DUF4276 family protein [Isosphaeraceae bacterium]